uniref:Brinker DNA-binding domain-containing protein n=1 Tax=Amblyomma sculptum TaxID=1581419 RepID=A0A1E1XP85_AMBSC
MTPAAKKGKYDPKFKLQVIQFAEHFSNRAAGTKFGLNESTIRGWRKVKKAATASTPPATPPPRGHAASALHHRGCWPQAPVGAAACYAPRPPGEMRGEPGWSERWHHQEPARALAAADASLYRKCPPREPQASEPPSPARAPAFLSPCEYPSYAPPTVPAAAAPPLARRVLLRGDYGNGFPEVTVPFTVIAEKAVRARCEPRGQTAPTGACATDQREVFASLLGLTPNRLVDNVT